MSGSVPVHIRSRRGAAALIALAALALAGCSSTVGGSPSPSGSGGGSAPPVSSAPAAAPTTDPAPQQSGPQAKPGDSFDDSQGRFDLLPPEGWEVDTSGAQGTAAVFLAPEPVDTPAGPFQPNVNVIVGAAPGGELEDLLAGTRTELESLNAYRSTADEDLVLSDGTKAHLFGGTFTDEASGLDLQNLQVFTVHEGSVYVVTGTAPRDSWSDYEKVLDESVRTLTVAT